MHRFIMRISAVCFSILFLYACKSAKAPAATMENNNTITDKTWKLVELNGQPVKADPTNKKEPFLILRSNDKIITGSGGCNSFRGSFELKDGNRIAISKLAATLMACANMETEPAFFKVIEMADNYVLVRDSLVLNKARMAPLARFVLAKNQ
jgi:heat shock protein HslJ